MASEPTRPFVRLKLASSLDGRIATASGVSRWITGPEARRRVHELRARVDAVAVGIGTALADDPELLPRDAAPVPDGTRRAPPMRVVFDSRLRMPDASKLVRGTSIAPVCIVTAADASPDEERRLTASGVQVLRIRRATNGQLDLADALEQLGALHVENLLVEGGAHLAGSLIEADLVDELLWFVAPIVLGAQGSPAIVGPSPLTPEAAPRWSIQSTTRVGDDVELVMRPRR